MPTRDFSPPSIAAPAIARETNGDDDDEETRVGDADIANELYDPDSIGTP